MRGIDALPGVEHVGTADQQVGGLGGPRVEHHAGTGIVACGSVCGAPRPARHS